MLKARHPVTKLLYVLKTEKYIMSTGIPVFDEDGNIILVVVSEYDMTTLNTLQVQLEELRDVADKYKDELAHLKLSGFSNWPATEPFFWMRSENSRCQSRPSC